MVASCPSLPCSCGKKNSLVQRSRGFGHGVRYVTVTMQCLCSQLLQCSFCLWSPRPLVVASCEVGLMFPCNKGHQSNEQLSRFSFWPRRGCQPFSCRCSLNVMHCRKEIYGTCLSKESMPFVKSKPPLPTVAEAWGPREPQHPPPSHYGCIMLARDRVVVSKLWITDYWLWSRLFYTATAARQWRIVEIELLATVGWKQGCQPAFQLPMFAKYDALKEICSTCLSNGIHAFCEI